MIQRFDGLRTICYPMSGVAVDKFPRLSAWDEPLVDKSFFERSASANSRVKRFSPTQGLYDPSPRDVSELELLSRQPGVDPSVIHQAVQEMEPKVQKALKEAAAKSKEQAQPAVAEPAAPASPPVATE